MSTNVDVELGAAPVKGQATPLDPQVIVVNTEERGCECTPGWVLFGVGWVVPLTWLVGVFLPLCTKNRNDKRAAIGSGVMIAVYALVLGLVLGLFVVPLLVAVNAAIGTANQMTVSGVTTDLTCYTSMGNNQVQALTHINKKQDALVCTKYRFTCTAGDTACTTAEAAQKAMKWSYVAVTKDTCIAMASTPKYYMGLVCCSTDFCNKPDPVAEPGITVVPGVTTANWA